MSNELNGIWKSLDGFDRARLIGLSLTPGLMLGLGTADGIDRVDVMVATILALMAITIWQMYIRVYRQNVRAEKNRQNWLSSIDGEIAASESGLDLTKD